MTTAQAIEARFPGWAVVWGGYSRQWWAFGAPDGQAISAATPAELAGLMSAAAFTP
jgi:hypothetical protein